MGFTMIEVVSQSEFNRHAPGESGQEMLSAEQVMDTAFSALDPREDPRHGRLFVVLGAEETLQHYSPRLSELRPFVGSDGAAVLRTVLVNERYLRLLREAGGMRVRGALVYLDRREIFQILPGDDHEQP